MTSGRASAPKVRRSIGEAKAHFAECVREAESGKTIILTRHGRSVARLATRGETLL